jgi:hypothetical protein
VTGKMNQGAEMRVSFIAGRQARLDATSLERVVSHVFGKLSEVPCCLAQQESGEIGRRRCGQQGSQVPKAQTLALGVSVSPGRLGKEVGQLRNVFLLLGLQ